MIPGSVIKYQNKRIPPSNSTWAMASCPRGRRGFAFFVADDGSVLGVSGIALQDLVLHLVPDLRVQLDETWRKTYLIDVARPRQVDRIFPDRPSRRSGREHDHAVGERNGLLEIVRDEQHRFTIRRP